MSTPTPHAQASLSHPTYTRHETPGAPHPLHTHLGRARTKIVATVGPACRSPEMLETLANTGADVFRLNMAHGDLVQHGIRWR